MARIARSTGKAKSTRTRTARRLVCAESAAKAAMVGSGNGLEDSRCMSMRACPRLRPRCRSSAGARRWKRARNANLLPTMKLSPEAAARLYLDTALASKHLESFARPDMEGAASEFGSLAPKRCP